MARQDTSCPRHESLTPNIRRTRLFPHPDFQAPRSPAMSVSAKKRIALCASMPSEYRPRVTNMQEPSFGVSLLSLSNHGGHSGANSGGCYPAAPVVARFDCRTSRGNPADRTARLLPPRRTATRSVVPARKRKQHNRGEYPIGLGLFQWTPIAI